MKKFILSICIIFLLFLISSVTLAQSSTTTWSMNGETFSSQQSDSGIVLTNSSGKTVFTGTISGNTVTGTQHLRAPACPDLTKDVPATGTISADGTMTIKYTAPLYDIDGCYDLPRTKEYTTSYTKTSSIVNVVPSPLVSPTPTKKPQPSVKPTAAVALQPTKPENQFSADQGQDGTPFNIFGLNPFETWTNLVRISNIPGALAYLVRETEFLLTPMEIESNVPEPAGGDWDFLPGYVPQKIQTVPVIITGQKARVVFDDKRKVEVNKNEPIPAGSKVMAGQPTKLLMGNNGKKVFLEARPFKNDEAVIKTPKSQDDKLFLEDGEVELVVEPDSGSIFGIDTPNGTVTVVQTHFLVRHENKNQQTTVIVYDGKVKFTGTDGKTTEVSPNGDKPGVVVVSQKLSTIKLALTGLVLTVVIGGSVLFLKRKFTSRGVSKKRR